MTVSVIVPVKSMADGKSRLAPVLTAWERRRLNERFLLKTIELARSVVGRRWIRVVSHCAEALAKAHSLGIVPIPERRGHDLNRALASARDQVVSDGAESLLVLPSDLPLATPDDLQAVLRAGERPNSAVVCPDRRGLGTNALYVHRPSGFRFRFGVNSAAAHTSEARRGGWKVVRFNAQGLGFDIDTPADYRDLAKKLNRT